MSLVTLSQHRRRHLPGKAPSAGSIVQADVSIPTEKVSLKGDLIVPPRARGIILFAHGSGSSRHSPRNQAVARVLRDHAFGTLLMDLLTEDEESNENVTFGMRFDIDLLARRLLEVT